MKLLEFEHHHSRQVVAAMFNWLRSGRRQGTPPIKPIAYEDVEGRSFDVIVDIVKAASNTPGAFNVHSAQAVSRRLIEIAWFEEDVEMAVRERAIVMEKVTWKSIEDALRSAPEALSARRDARNMHIEHGRVAGVFSLQRKISTVPPEQVIPEIISLRNAHLLPDFPREPLEGQRNGALMELIADRARLQISQAWVKSDDTSVSTLTTTNAVTTAGWLVLIRDPTALWLLTGSERLELGKYLDDYDRSRSRLIGLGVIQTGESASLLPPPEPRTLHDLIMQSAWDGTTGGQAGMSERYHVHLHSLPDAARRDFMVIVLCLRLFIWKKTLGSVYGTGFVAQVFSADPRSPWAGIAQGLLTKIENLYDLALTRDPAAAGLPDQHDNGGLHNLIVASETLDFVDRNLPEPDKTRLLNGFAAIFSAELFHFPQYVRFLLKFALYGEAIVGNAMTEDAVMPSPEK